MNARNVIAGLLTGAVCLSMMTACSQNGTGTPSGQDSMASSGQTQQGSRTEQSSSAADSQPQQSTPEDPAAEKTYTLTIRDADKHSAITAHFFNSNSGKSEDVEMKKAEEGEGYFLYTADANVNAYNMVHLTYGEDPTDDVAFNEFVSGWALKDDELLPYVKGEEPSYSPVYETKVFSFEGEDKNVYIWTPKDYDAKSAEKYDTIYMLDGQSVLSANLTEENDVWNVSECVEGMMAATGYKAILVNIEASGDRYAEMTTDIGGQYETDPVPGRKGQKFEALIFDTIMPYVEENYNVYTEASHNSIAGSSMGGQAALRFGLDHPDKIGTVGAFSSSLWVDDEETWTKYLQSKDFSKAPFIYMYCGSYGEDMGYLSEPFYQSLLELGFPKDKIVFHKNETGEHHVPFWRGVYPEFLEAAFTGKVTAIESGSEVKYVDRTKEEKPIVTPDENDTRPAEIVNYVFFDNSQTKWENVYAYWWGSGECYNKATNEPLYGDKWPGLQMEQLEGTDIYRIAAPVGAEFIIFDSGITDAEVKTGVIAYQTNDLHFDCVANAGQIYTIDVSEAPKHKKGVEKTKYLYYAGAWSNYEG